MQNVSCPSCGAEVSFRSAASVMAVCDYCQSTLLKDAESVKDIGKMSTVLEDYSPIQMNTVGVYEGNHFTVIGRIQLRYEAGFWNEWYVLFDDGSSGWLSDASGQYVFTLPQPDIASAPNFDGIVSGYRFTHQGTEFIASDVRTAQCIAGQGELPFPVNSGWQAKVADFRFTNSFLTLDYSDNDSPRCYLGKSVTLETLHCQLLRSNDDIAGTSGRFKGKTVPLDCPNCGGPIQYQAGMAFHIVCPLCKADVDCSADKATVLRKHQELVHLKSTLSLGDVGNIDGIKYSIIGLIKCREVDADGDPPWTEYLLFNPNKDFLWLVEVNDEWDKVTVLNEWPERLADNVIFLRNENGKKYKRLYEYDAIVTYAIGAFNWRISIGDKTHLTDYSSTFDKLTAERTKNEITWSFARPVSPTIVGQWFGKKLATTKIESASEEKSFTFKAAKIYSLMLVGLNVPIAFASGVMGLLILLVGLCLIWVPALIYRQQVDSD